MQISPRHSHEPHNTIAGDSAPGIFRPPSAVNEPVKKDTRRGAPSARSSGSGWQRWRGERVEVPLVIGGEASDRRDVRGDDASRPAPRARRRPQGGAATSSARSPPRRRAADWSATPWEERAAVFLRAAELLAGPWRATLNAATMLGQSKTAHQAEIDAACELIDFWRFNVEYLVRIYEEQPVSSPGVWNRLEYRPLEGFVFAVSPSTSPRSAATCRPRRR